MIQSDADQQTRTTTTSTTIDSTIQPSEPPRLNRRRTLGIVTASASAAAIAIGTATATRHATQAQSETPTPVAPAIVPIQSTTVGEMPTTGAIRGHRLASSHFP